MQPVTPNSDLRQLDLLAIFHWVLAGLTGVGLLFLLGHFFLMQAVMNLPDMRGLGGGLEPAPDPAGFFRVFRWTYVLIGGGMLLALVGNVLSGWYLKRRIRRGFSFALAAFNCLGVPLGTVLGIFTIVLLSRDSVRALYGASAESSGHA